jgi:hypothetical protein
LFCGVSSVVLLIILFLWSSTAVAPPKTAAVVAENHQFDAMIKEKDMTNLKPSRPETGGWPQVPMSLVNQYGKSISSEDNPTKR